MAFRRLMKGCAGDVLDFTANIQLSGFDTRHPTASFTITAPPCKQEEAKLEVHLEEPTVDYFIPLNSNSFILDFSVAVVDSNGDLVSGVTVSGLYEDPNGDTIPFEIIEEGDAVPAIEVPVTLKGDYTFTVTDVTGPNVIYAPSLNEGSTSAQVLVQARVTEETSFEGDPPLGGVLSTEIQELWASDACTVASSCEPLVYYAARAEDLNPWKDNLRLGRAVTRTGFSVQILEVPPGAAPVDQAFMEGVLDATPPPSNCSLDHGRGASPVGFVGRPDEILDIYGCDAGVTYWNAVKYNESAPDVYLLLQGSSVSIKDFNLFHRFKESVRWESSGRIGDQRTVHISEVSGAFYNDLDGEVGLTLAVVDSGEIVFIGSFSGFYQHPFGALSPFETTQGPFPPVPAGGRARCLHLHGDRHLYWRGHIRSQSGRGRPHFPSGGQPRLFCRH